jgi:hypothetical protein
MSFLSNGISRAVAQPNRFGLLSDIGQFVSGAVSPTKTDNHFVNNGSPETTLGSIVSTPSTPQVDYYTGGGTAGSGSGGTVSPNYSALINDQLGRLDGQQATGLNNILSSYNSAFNTLTNQKNQAQGQYDTTRNQTIQDNQTAKDQIASSVRNGLSGLQRLLGAHGAGNSSAAQILAPYAAGFQGNQQRQQVNQAYGRNMGALDTNWQNTLQDFANSFGSLATDKGNRENTLRQQILQSRASLLGQLPNPDLNQINALGHQIDGLGAVQSFDPGVHQFNAPNLDQYNFDPSQGANVNAPVDGAESNVGPFFQLLGKKKQGVGV